eukprot:4757347-Heterocapsa_arctica.AAC.1
MMIKGPQCTPYVAQAVLTAILDGVSVSDALRQLAEPIAIEVLGLTSATGSAAAAAAAVAAAATAAATAATAAVSGSQQRLIAGSSSQQQLATTSPTASGGASISALRWDPYMGITQGEPQGDTEVWMSDVGGFVLIEASNAELDEYFVVCRVPGHRAWLSRTTTGNATDFVWTILDAEFHNSRQVHIERDRTPPAGHIEGS